LLPPEQAAQAPQLIFNDRLDAVLTVLFFATTWLLVFETLRVCHSVLRGRRYPPLSETPHIPSRLVEDWVRD
jgi:carbon starvation protein